MKGELRERKSEREGGKGVEGERGKREGEIERGKGRGKGKGEGERGNGVVEEIGG